MSAALYDTAVAGLSRLPDEERRETYVVSFFVYDQGDDPRLPTLTVGNNTASRVQSVMNQATTSPKLTPWTTPADDGEAKWNYAFWLQNRLGVFPGSRSDRELCDRWLRAEGAWFEEVAGGEEREELGLRITERFVELCVSVARRLHGEGDIGALFGQQIPVVVHELEYYEQIADQTLAANPLGVADEFAAWVRFP